MKHKVLVRSTFMICRVLTMLFLFAGLGMTQEIKAATAELVEGSYLYCDVQNSNFASSSAKMRFNWFWNSGDHCCSDNGSNLTGNIWYAKVPNAYTRYVQILRMKEDWSKQWNYSNGITVSSRSNDKQNCIKITGSKYDAAEV